MCERERDGGMKVVVVGKDWLPAAMALVEEADQVKLEVVWWREKDGLPALCRGNAPNEEGG